MRLDKFVLLIFFFVSIHASVKDATFSKVTSPLSTIVSIHASVKDATYIRYADIICKKVSIHASVKDATENAIKFFFHTSSFNPRICKRCDSVWTKCGFCVTVSIHASVKDATFPRAFSHRQHLVSIHASVKDATPAGA